jgi:hypothetical protein
VSTSTGSFLETVNRNFDAAAAYGDYPAGLLEQIRTCNSIYQFTFRYGRKTAATKSSRRGGPSIAITSSRIRSANGSLAELDSGVRHAVSAPRGGFFLLTLTVAAPIGGGALMKDASESLLTHFTHLVLKYSLLITR